ncbi:hypothetical protein V2J09_000680 [Rumex salicifolius]
MANHKYKECLKNHAASIGGNALDGCGEFIPLINRGEGNQEDDPLGSLKCAACGCHRNFHRKEAEGKNLALHPTTHYYNSVNPIGNDQGIMGYPCVFGMLSESEDHGGDGLVAVRAVERKKRVRSKFSQEQKERMLRFAEKAGWKMVGLEDSVVHQFCQEIGIKRRVLKVWMHNNKHNYANKNAIT